ncbi:MAG TPA: cofactor-independent phosphoglycerate mutase, partial [Desulfatiglandales bacterium]|nr:cofactor-independent phosphoglycerate mutase [Desulfatiglandales bacterium]
MLVGDGMADYPLQELGGKTPLQAAQTPNMDRIAACRVGLVRTIPDGMEPGSDVANLSLLGYDPRVYHTRRAPFEAASMGVELKPEEVAYRMNLVTLDFNTDHEVLMVSHSSGDLSSEDARQIVDDLKKELRFPGTMIYQGVGYRHLLVWQNGPEEATTIPPHDVLGQNMAPYLNQAADNQVQRLIRMSWPILKPHPVNRRRREQKEKEANSIWLWGQGRAPRLPRFVDKYGVKGAVICAVDLLRGMGIYAGFEPIYVQGATGYLNTNYRGKAEAALQALARMDFVFLHVEAPDEAGHAGNPKEKIEAIENFDRKVVGTVLEGLERFDDFRVMVVSDHLTPIVKRTH